MRRLRFVLTLTLLGLLAFPPATVADHGSADEASPNMLHVHNLGTPPEFETGPPNEPRFNSDLAFWSAGGVRGPFHDLAAQGNYDGFRLIDIRDPENPTQISVVECRGSQGDVSFYQAGERLLLIQSVDRPVTTSDCATARDTPVISGIHPITGLPGVFFTPGFEGLRIFDVSDPMAPRPIASVATACGSHTHTTIPDQMNQRAIVYVSSYPIGASVTPANVEAPGPRCQQPHAKISIVEIPDRAPEAAQLLREQPLHPDTLPFWGTLGTGGTGAVGCNDITVLYETQSPNPGQNVQPHSKPKVAAAACLEEGQLWDVSDPANPTTLTAHSHIRNAVISTTRGLFSGASFTWDGQVVAFSDEFEGGGANGCNGPQDTRGNVWFYKNVSPGTPIVPLFGRYQIPRPQPPDDACTLNGGNIIPTNEG